MITLSKNFGWLLGAWVAVANLSPLNGQEPVPAPAIVVVRSYDSADAGSAAAGRGLGFIVESQGLILTSYEILKDEETERLRPTVTAQLVGGEQRFDAAIVGIEPTLNFAILKIEPEDALPESKLCAREEIQVGQVVRALAEIEGGKASYADGEITDLNSKECYQDSMTATMLRARIEIPRSSLGGPVFDRDGEVVAIFTGHVPQDDGPPEEADGQSDEEHLRLEKANEGKVHLLPMFLVSNIYESLKLKKSLKSPWTGFSVRPITEEERKLFPYNRFRGAVGIEHVWKGGPAEKLGILEDDLLVGFSYYKTNTVAEFQKWLYAHGVGFEVKLSILRGGSEFLTIPYTIEERPKWAVPK
ncbi:hypothetical protein BH23VER1_BH23VER1_27390 [soil metagenome]